MKQILNTPELWASLLPVPGAETHKYQRGHAVVLGGTRMTGAARLAAEAAMRIGAGLCTIAADPAVAQVYQGGAPHVLFEPLRHLRDFPDHVQDERRNAVLIGPGAGQDDGMREIVLKIPGGDSRAHKKTVLDADALTVFAGRGKDLFPALHEDCVLTPHEGEFERLFGILSGTKAARAAQAAAAAGAVIVLKGAETVIAHPDGRVVLNRHSSPYLATAGSGDVLAGMVTGLLAQGMEAFMAACAAVWIHGDCAIRIGPGLVAPDLTGEIPQSLKTVLDLRR